MPDESKTPPEAQPAEFGQSSPASPSHLDQPERWPAWYFALTDALKAARAPAITAVAYILMVGIPDQSAEAARIMLGWPWYWAIGASLLWFMLSLYLALSLAGLAERALGIHREPGAVREVPLAQKTVVLFVFSAPFIAGFLVLGPMDLLTGDTKVWDHQRGWVIYVPLFYFGLFALTILYPLVVSILDAILDGGRDALFRRRRAESPSRARAMLDSAWRMAGAWSGGMTFAAALLFLAWVIGWGSLEYFFGIYAEIPTLLFLPFWATALCAGLLLLVRLSVKRRMPILMPALLLVLFWSFFDLSDNHGIQHRRLAAAAIPEAAPLRVDLAFGAWLDARRAEVARWTDSGRNFPVLLVAAEGGGARAAYFTALVLEELRARCPRLMRHTFLIAGVSGGSVGASLVAASAAAPPTREPRRGPARAAPPPADSCELPRGDGSIPVRAVGADADAPQALRADLLSPLVRGLLLPDVIARLLPADLGRILPGAALRRGWDDYVRLPFSDITDRSRFLERAIDRAWERRTGRDIDSLPFRSVWPGPEGDVPALMLLTTDVTTGRRVAVSHLAMPPPPAPAAPPGRPPAPPPAPPAAAPGLATAAPDPGCAPRLTADAPATALARLRTLGEEAPGIDVSLTTAAVLSARFTLMTPAGTLPCPGSRRRLVDGGYFENSGLTTVLEVVDALRQTARNRQVALHILRIENSRATTNAGNAYGVAPQDPPGWLAELASPLRALMATREARGEQARAAVSRAVEQSQVDCRAARRARIAADESRGLELTRCVEIGEIAFTLAPGCVPIPLGWSLSDGARQEMQEQLLGVPAAKGCAEEGQADRARNRAAAESVLWLLMPPSPPL